MYKSEEYRTTDSFKAGVKKHLDDGWKVHSWYTQNVVDTDPFQMLEMHVIYQKGQKALAHG